MNDEVYYCGNCDRQQQPRQGEKCIVCEKVTVSWHTDREKAEDARRKWKSINR